MPTTQLKLTTHGNCSKLRVSNSCVNRWFDLMFRCFKCFKCFTTAQYGGCSNTYLLGNLDRDAQEMDDNL